jgi:4-amino-4-deoxy-L-arabinose transferase-like glycosyltransferase
MLVVILLLTWGSGYGLVAALRPREQGWRSRDVFWAIVLGVSLTSWLGQILADAAWFSWWRLAGMLTALNLGLLAWGRSRLIPRGIRASWRELGALGAIVLLGAGLFFPPAEIVLGGRDDGIRLLAGMALARQGGWIQHTPLGNDLPRYGGATKTLGSVLVDQERELVMPQFTGAYEVWQAIAYGWREHDPSVVVNLRTAHPWMFLLSPILGLLALVACYMLGREIVGHWAAIIGTGLLTISMAQVWYARLIMAEILFQFLLLGGLAASIAYARRPSRETALTAGLALGVAVLTKVDGLVALGMLVAAMVVLWPQRRRWEAWPWLILPLLLTIGHYVIHSVLFSGSYFGNNTGSLFINPTLLIMSGLGLFGLAVFVWLRLRYRERFDALWVRPWPQSWRIAVLAALVAMMGYAYVVRPSVLAGEGYIHPFWKEWIYTQRGLNFVLLVEYITPLGAALAVAGLSRWLLRDLRWYHGPFLAVLLGYTIVFTYNAFVVGDQPFWVRRFLPIVIPGALLLAGAALLALWRTASRWRLGAPLLLLALIGWLGWYTLPTARLQTGAGLGAQVERFAAQFPPNAVVLFEDWSTGFSLAAPLEIGYGREIYQLSGEPLQGADAEKWQAQLQRWTQAGRPLFYVASTENLTIPETGWDWQPIGSQQIQYSALATTHTSVPREVLEFTQTLSTYRIVPAAQPPSACQVSVDLGKRDYGPIGSGWYDAEPFSASAMARWSQPKASLALPPLAGTGDLTATLVLADLRPTIPPTATIQFALGDQIVSTQPLVAGWYAYSFAVPTSAITQPTTLLSWQVPGWLPQDLGMSDARELGVAATTFTLQRSQCER